MNCIKCKGKNPKTECGRSFCPIIAKNKAFLNLGKDYFKKDFVASSNNVFISRMGYPNLNVGFLSPAHQTDDWIYDSYSKWAFLNTDIKTIVNLRSSLINSKFKSGVMETSKNLDFAQEVALSSKPVDVDLNLEKKPIPKINQLPDLLPMGPSSNLKKIRFMSNAKIDTKVYKVVDDTDFKSKNAMLYLYDKGYDESFISRMLSVGTLGVKNSRKLVPTRWSITATDDLLSKNNILELKDFKVGDYSCYFDSYLGNYYLVMFLPRPWAYELFELYQPNASFNQSNDLNYSTDFELFNGRKTYAENCAGGYYSVRLAVTEKLKQIKKQNSVVVIRVITGEYYSPLGVFVTREASRKSLKKKPIEFSSLELMRKYVTILFNKKFGIEIHKILKRSVLLRELKTQTTLSSFG